MTKLKELIEMHDKVDASYVATLQNKSILEETKERYRKLLIRQRAEYKTLLDYVKQPYERHKSRDAISDAEEKYEESVMKIYNLQQECNHEIVMLIDETRKNNVVKTYYCPICNSKFVKVGNNKMNSSYIIDETQNPNKNNYFGPCREIEIEFLSKIKRLLITHEEITVEEFFEGYQKENPEKCKKKIK